MSAQLDYKDYSTLVISLEGKVATVSINRPDSMNSINNELHHELSWIFGQLADDASISVIVLTGMGKAFCAGGDLPWLEGLANSLPTHLENIRVGQRIVMSILECPKPIICRLNGDAIGLGATIALLCDIIIASDTARIADPHVKIGLVAGDGGALIWPQLIGYAKAKARARLSSSASNAPEAARLGLINYAVKAEELDATVDRFVDKILAASQAAVGYTKLAINLPLRQCVHSVLEMSLAFEGLTMLQNADLKEGIKAFGERRAPNFTKERNAHD